MVPERGFRNGAAASSPVQSRAGTSWVSSGSEGVVWRTVSQPSGTPALPGEREERRRKAQLRVESPASPRWRRRRPTPRAWLAPFSASSRAGGIEAPSHDSCFHLVRFQVGQAGAGGAGTPAHLHLARNADLPAASRSLGHIQDPGAGAANCKAGGAENRRAFESNTEKTDVSEPTTAGLAWPGLSPPRHSCHFLLVLKDVLWRVWPLLTRCQQHTLL